PQRHREHREEKDRETHERKNTNRRRCRQSRRRLTRATCRGDDPMPSHSLIRWNGERADALDEIENAHVMVGGTERGRRYATQQVNYSYATLLSSHFQGFCRDLHTESVERIVAIVPAPIPWIVNAEFMWHRAQDR